MVDSPYSDVRDRVRSASESFTTETQRVRMEWNDAAAAAAEPEISRVDDALAALGVAVGRQEESHGVIDRLAEVTRTHSDVVDRLVGESAEMVGEAQRALAEASEAAARARAAASQSSARVREALQMVGGAGAGCGQAIGGGPLQALVHRRVVGERKRRVWGMAGRALAVEVEWWLGQELALGAARIPGVALPPTWGDQARLALTTDVPVLATHLSAFVAGMRDRWR